MTGLIIFDEFLEDKVKKEFKEEATQEFLSLISIGVMTYEHAYKFDTTAEEYLIWIRDEIEGRAHNTRAIMMKNKTQEFSLIYTGITAREQVSMYKIKKGKYIDWVSEAWGFGKHQRQVADMEAEGELMNETGIVLSLGARLSLFVKEEGHMS